jgi:sulfate adenylyltransferase subunit 1
MALGPLRIITAGCVDDGKSTLIGRLLLDTHSIFSDQLSELQRISSRTGDALNLALITDGLRAERLQGITIDAGFRYFAVRGRKIILADTPGHVEYTRNMVAAASNAEAAVVLVDASRGIAQQTRRHILIAYLLGVRYFVICLNKFDLVGYSQNAFEDLTRTVEEAFSGLPGAVVSILPASALFGDNIVTRSSAMPWYVGPTLVDLLETIPNRFVTERASAFSVQWVIQPADEQRPIFAGRLLSGVISVGDQLTWVPSLQTLRVETVSIGSEQYESADTGRSIGISFDRDAGIGRGDLIVAWDTQFCLSNTARAALCWLSEQPCRVNTTYLFQQHGKSVDCKIEAIRAKLDVDLNFWDEGEKEELVQNEIGKVELKLSEELLLFGYEQDRSLGAGILIDPLTNDTVGGVMIESSHILQEVK